MSEEPTKPPRRKRYAGRNPRKFEDKYKEHDPGRYAGTVAKVLASGKTPAGSHVPVLTNECLDSLALRAGMTGVDCTLGYGGHARRILERIAPRGFLLGLDQDPVELPKTEARLREAGFGPDAFLALRSNYAGIAKALAAQGMEQVDFILADLGCSSMQYDDPARGFSFKHDGPLDMRMNPARGLSAKAWLERVTPCALEEVLREHSDEPQAVLLGRALAGGSFGTTTALARAVGEVVGGETADAAIRRVFQAVRIAVNEESGALEMLLRALPGCLKAGARVAILTFHSGEDRRVKKSFKQGVADGVYARMSDGVIVAGPDERRMNPRSAPAKLRWAEKACKAGRDLPPGGPR